MIDLNNKTSSSSDERRPNVIVMGMHRSGTTLMHLLTYYGFHDTEFIFPEMIHATSSVGVESDEKFLVYKAFFELDDPVKLFESVPEARVITTIRDPRDMVTSRNISHEWKYIQNLKELCPRIKRLVEVVGGFPDRSIVVKFEDLVSDPDGVQLRIAEQFGMDVKKKFSECHEDFDAFSYNQNYINYIGALKRNPDVEAIRPIDRKGIGRWSSVEHQMWFMKCVAEYGLGEFNDLLIELGYEKSLAWWRDYTNENRTGNIYR